MSFISIVSSTMLGFSVWSDSILSYRHNLQIMMKILLHGQYKHFASHAPLWSSYSFHPCHSVYPLKRLLLHAPNWAPGQTNKLSRWSALCKRFLFRKGGSVRRGKGGDEESTHKSRLQNMLKYALCAYGTEAQAAVAAANCPTQKHSQRQDWTQTRLQLDCM